MLKRLILLVFAALVITAPPLALSGCATPTAPATQSVVDEKVAIGVNAAYKAFRISVETGVNAGLIKGPLAGRLADIDNRAYQAVLLVDAAYRAAQISPTADNLAAYYAAAREAYSIIGSGQSLVDAKNGG